LAAFLFGLKAELQVLKLEFCQIKWGETTDKLAINWKISTQVGLNSSLLIEYGR